MLFRSPPSQDAYFWQFVQSLRDFPVKLKHFRDIESDLQNLDAASWEYLKAELVQPIKKRDQTRGWQALFDKLNEAKGYSYLVRLGCTNVVFIPRSSIQGQKTPDLQADLDSIKVICEVKTINISKFEANHRYTGSARSTSLLLHDNFFRKLKSDLEFAGRQLAAVSEKSEDRRIVYTVINFDDSLHEYADDYRKQIDAFIATIPMPAVEIKVDVKPPFYSARA